VTRSLELEFSEPAPLGLLIEFLAARCVARVEEFESLAHGWVYRRALRLPRGTGVVEVHAPHGARLPIILHLDDEHDEPTATAQVRALFDLDADPNTIDAVLGADPLLAPSVRARPGLRVPGHVDAHELAVRAVLGQQVSVQGARTFAGRLVERHGIPLAHPVSGVTHSFPSSGALARGSLDGMGLTGGRIRAIHAMCEAISSGTISLDPDADVEKSCAALLALPGIGPWTVSYVRMRSFADADAFLPTDLGVKHAMAALGAASDPKSVAQHARRWQPWRAYALMHLWCSLGDPIRTPAIT
jgi:AraC family transcriptional regulator, regulatory protein of adaptative response / DNA-3-methyladenine glycosylase II